MCYLLSLSIFLYIYNCDITYKENEKTGFITKIRKDFWWTLVRYCGCLHTLGTQLMKKVSKHQCVFIVS